MNDVEKYFASKSRLAEREISDDSIALALAFNDKKAKTTGYLLVTRTKADVKRFELIPVRLSNRGGAIPFVLIGSGHYGDFQAISAKARKYVQDAMHLYGSVEALSTAGLLDYLAETISRVYINRRKAYGIDLLLISSLGKFEMHRIKYNGEYHPCHYYGVVGGYQKIEAGNATLRKGILKLIDDFYNKRKRLPALAQVEKLAEKIMNMEKDKGEITAMTFAASLAE